MKERRLLLRSPVLFGAPGTALGLALLAAAACSDDQKPAAHDVTGRDAGVDGAAGGPGEGGASGPLVTIGDGQLRGQIDGSSRRFLGIPFAKPPVGNLRWKAPVKNEAWTGVRDASKFGGRCAQPSSLQGAASSEEDCLYLNVWTPDPAPSTPLPVMFWIHGGGNETGSTSDEVPLGVGDLFYNGRAFAESHGVVVVTTNYRLGVLGFFAHSALASESSPAGNQGLLDQRLAMQWVQDNIRAFGGDPGKVTIFGESAGSLDVCLHVASPGSRGLFHRAISQSGGCTTRLTLQSEAEQKTAAFASALGCNGHADTLACLRSKPVAELMIDAPTVPGPTQNGDGGVSEGGANEAGMGDAGALPGGDRYQGTASLWDFGPVVDGTLLPDQPRKSYDAGDIARVPYILGSNSDEGTLFHLGSVPVANEAEYLAALGRAFGARAAEVLAKYPVASFASADAALQRVTGDSRLVCGTHDTARRAAAAGLDVYMYNFDLPIAITGFEFLGAVHGAEIAYVFGDLKQWPDADSKNVSDAMLGYWSRFGITGDPNGLGALPWPKFSVQSDKRMQFGRSQTTVDDFRADKCGFWRTFYDAAFN